MILIKRYPNRKLYDTKAKQYITLDGIADLIRQGDEVQVIDHATGEDLTALTLAQIILDQEKEEGGLFPHSTLMNWIRVGGNRLNALQRSIFSSMILWPLIDEEIKRRIQALVDREELTEAEGCSVLDKLIKQGARQREERRRHDERFLVSAEELEEYLNRRQVPTQEDIHQLHHQLEELSARLEGINKEAMAPTQDTPA